MRPRLIVVGASWGGLQALQKLLGDLPTGFPLPIAIVLHRQRHAGEQLCYLLQSVTPLVVQDVVDKMPIEPGRVYLAPADYHLLVEAPDYFSLTVEEPVQFSRPSVDVLFESAAQVHGAGTIGVVLTGANRDGAAGLARIKALGGVALIEDPRTAENPIMPAAAAAAVPDADYILPLEQLAGKLIDLTTMNPYRR